MRVLRFRPTGRSVGGSGGSRGWWSGQAQRSSFCVRVSHGAQRPPGPRGVAGVRVSFWEWSSVWVDGRPSVCSPADRPLGFREPSCREHGWASRSLGPVPGGAIPDLTAVLTFWGAPPSVRPRLAHGPPAVLLVPPHPHGSRRWPLCRRWPREQVRRGLLEGECSGLTGAPSPSQGSPRAQ